MSCPTCKKRRVAQGDSVCRTCRRFIKEYIESGTIKGSQVPMVTDVLTVMQRLGVSQDRALIILGGQP